MIESITVSVLTSHRLRMAQLSRKTKLIIRRVRKNLRKRKKVETNDVEKMIRGRENIQDKREKLKKKKPKKQN